MLELVRRVLTQSEVSVHPKFNVFCLTLHLLLHHQLSRKLVDELRLLTFGRQLLLVCRLLLTVTTRRQRSQLKVLNLVPIQADERNNKVL